MEMEVWDIYFASLAGWALHPGYLRPDAKPPSVQVLAKMADLMMEERNGRIHRGSGSRS